MPTHLIDTEAQLDQAEQDFKDGVFAPFWDSIELATKWLGRFDSNVGEISNNSKRYTELVANYKSTPPRFPIVVESVQGLAASTVTADRMKAIVRKAQANPTFAMIYEQRRTNQLLISGFTNLAQALDGMGRRIAASIEGLQEQISDMSVILHSSLTSIGQQLQESNEAAHNLNETLEGMHTTIQNDNSEQTERHDKALEMLDNIQRRRMPTGFYAGIGTKPAP